MKKLLATAAIVASMALGMGAPAHAEYPEGPVQFVVPWPPGDFEDDRSRHAESNRQTCFCSE